MSRLCRGLFQLSRLLGAGFFARRLGEMGLLLQNLHHFGGGDDEMPDGVVLLIACDEISTVVPLLHGDFIEHKVVHVNQDFARRFWLHLDAELERIEHSLRLDLPEPEPEPPPEPQPELLDPQAMKRLQDLDPGGRNQLVRRVMQAFDASISRLLPSCITAIEIAISGVAHAVCVKLRR